MFVISFTPPRVIEFREPAAFAARAHFWLHQREGENTYLIGRLRDLDPRGDPGVRLFTIEQDDAIIAAGAFASSGCLYLTWASPEAIKAILEHLVSQRWPVNAICAPVHIGREIGDAIAARSGNLQAILRAERVFQLTHVGHTPPSTGRLEVAQAGDKPLAKRWFQAFVDESDFQGDVARDPRAVDWLIDPRRLYLWKAPEPVAMASWVAPTMNSGAINYVYVPPEHRGRGHAKAVTAALAQQMLASGLRCCFILAEATDVRLHHLYQSIGAHAVGDLGYFNIVAQTPSQGKSPSGDSQCPAGTCAS